MTILSVLTFFIGSLLSPFNGNDKGDLAIVLVLSLIRLITSIIGTVIGVMLGKTYVNKTLTMQSIFLIVLLVANIVILLNTTVILFALLNFF